MADSLDSPTIPLKRGRGRPRKKPKSDLIPSYSSGNLLSGQNDDGAGTVEQSGASFLGSDVDVDDDMQGAHTMYDNVGYGGADMNGDDDGHMENVR